MEEELEDIPMTKDVLKAGDVYSRALRLAQVFPNLCHICHIFSDYEIIGSKPPLTIPQGSGDRARLKRESIEFGIFSYPEERFLYHEERYKTEKVMELDHNLPEDHNVQSCLGSSCLLNTTLYLDQIKRARNKLKVYDKREILYKMSMRLNHSMSKGISTPVVRVAYRNSAVIGWLANVTFTLPIYVVMGFPGDVIANLAPV
uniref:Uncharacterized protein n=1 Tax=Timema poppense TaxID=170557 RepID=A0A7R9DED4_TIMPO|nr:unnamed protein product [Timema poppensis]